MWLAFQSQGEHPEAMKRTLVIVADLGNFNVYQWESAPRDSKPHLELINAFENVEAHAKRPNTATVMEKSSAQKVHNPRMSATGSDGEQHNMQLEKRRRLVRET